MSIESSKIPSLHFPITPFTQEDVSPRSEEFRESPSMAYSIFPAPRLTPQLANMPNRTISSQELKNPLLPKQVDYEMQVRIQEQELIALTNIQQKLNEKLKIVMNEFNTVKDVPDLMKEKDEIIKKLEAELELAQGKAKETESEGMNVLAKEVYRINRPTRIWKVQEEVKELQDLREKVIKLIL